MELTTKEVAKILKVTKQTIYNWMRKGKIPEPSRDYRGYRVFSEDDLKRMLDYKNRTSSVPED